MKGKDASVEDIKKAIQSKRKRKEKLRKNIIVKKEMESNVRKYIK